MLDVITRREYFQWLDNDWVVKRDGSLKDIQDGFIFSILEDYKGKKVAEMGGGGCRLLRQFSQQMECWNIDKLEGLGNGPKTLNSKWNIKLVQDYIGNFSPEIPENYFDMIFSISVMEHIADDHLANVFKDIYRILQKGGFSYHAIDFVIGDSTKSNRRASIILNQYVQLIQETGFQLVEEAIMDVNNVSFKSSYASNSDIICHRWALNNPKNRKGLEEKQVVSIKLGFKKPG